MGDLPSRAACLWAACAVAGCAHPVPQRQAVEVRVEADSPAWVGPLACQASNDAGTWSFTAPGSVAVAASAAPLRIACQVPAGALLQPSVTAPAAADASERRERGREGAAAGARIGAGAGVALGAAAAPVMGGPFAILIAAGAAIKGGEIGGMVAALRGAARSRYPSPIVLRIGGEPTVAPGP